MKITETRHPDSYRGRPQAQMAESVDALVSNTNVFGRAGSTPALGTENPFRCKFEGIFAFLGKLLANISENQVSVCRGNQEFVWYSLAKSGLKKLNG